MVPKKVPKEPKPLSSASANPWDALPDKKVRETKESPVDGRTNPKYMRYVITRCKSLCIHTCSSCRP